MKVNKEKTAEPKHKQPEINTGSAERTDIEEHTATIVQRLQNNSQTRWQHYEDQQVLQNRVGRQRATQLMQPTGALPHNQSLQLQTNLTAPASSNATNGLPHQLKNGMETLSGIALDDVKVHYNSSKPAQVQALAYAYGNDIQLGPGQEGNLPHEAWHVVQQKQGRVKPTLQLKTGTLVNDDSALEKEADIMGEKALGISKSNSLPLAKPNLANSHGLQRVMQGIWARTEGGKNLHLKNRHDGTYIDNKTQKIYKVDDNNIAREVEDFRKRRRDSPEDPNPRRQKVKKVKHIISKSAVANSKARRSKKSKYPKSYKLASAYNKKLISARYQKVYNENIKMALANIFQDVQFADIANQMQTVEQEPANQMQIVEKEPAEEYFFSLNYAQKEQVLAVARSILQQTSLNLEEQLANYIVDNATAEMETIDKIFQKMNNQMNDSEDENFENIYSIRDQSYKFNMDVSKTNALFGGSINTVGREKVDDQLVIEEPILNDELFVASQYAEASRNARNNVTGKVDTRLVQFLKQDPSPENRLLIFAYMRKHFGMSLFEVFFSLKEAVSFQNQGWYIYREIPLEFLAKIDWQVYPDYFETPSFLSLVADYLYANETEYADEHRLQELKGQLVGKFPPELLDIVESKLTAINKPEKKLTYNEEDTAKIPPVLLQELRPEQLKKILKITKKNEYKKLLNEFKEDENVATYLSTAILFSSKYEAKQLAPAYQGIANVLFPPGEQRSGGLVSQEISRQQKATLKRSVNQISEFLGDYDFGVSIEDAKNNIEELLENDIDGAHKINKYIAGGFGVASDTLDAPWQIKNEKLVESSESVQGAVRGLEGLPTYEGWSYRLEKGSIAHEVGEIIAPGVLWSSALSPEFAIQFDREQEGTIYIIKSHYTGKHVQLLAGTTKWYQREVVFPPYARFVVEDKQETDTGRTFYTVKEISPFDEDAEIDSLKLSYDKRQAKEQAALETFIDKKHYDIAVEKYANLEPWSSDEADKKGIENLRSGIYHPRELYGLQNFRRWQKVLNADTDTLWTLEGFMQIASDIVGKERAIRDYPTGWHGEHSLTWQQAASLNEKNILLIAHYDVNEFQINWQNLVRKDKYLYTFNYREFSAKDWLEQIEGEEEIPLFYPDIIHLKELGALKLSFMDTRNYEVLYGHGIHDDQAKNKKEADKNKRQNRQEVETAIKTVLAHYAGEFDQLTSNNIENYNKKVTELAANLQQDIVAIHPFSDGNGRISRMYMYKVLKMYLSDDSDFLNNLPVIPDPGADLATSKDDWGKMLWDRVSKKN